MPIPPVPIPRQYDPGDMFQRDARVAFAALADGCERRVTVTGVALGLATVRVRHNLGRIPVGWSVVDATAAATVYRDATDASTTEYIPLKATAATTVSLQFW